MLTSKKGFRFILILLILFVSFRFWFGIYIDEEFCEPNLFLKYRPIWKWKFYSPIGESDIKLIDLSEEKQQEELLFEEFVKNKR